VSTFHAAPVSLRGKLTLSLRSEQGGVAKVEIVSTRPQAATLLKGKTPPRAVHLAPLIFSLCGGAQGVAAEAALTAAAGGTPDGAQLAHWALSVRREAATEHLWRLMLDWPHLTGLERLEAEYASCRRHCLLAKADDELAVALQAAMPALLGMPAQEWLAQDGQAFARWREQARAFGARILRRMPEGACANAVPFLPATAAQDWVRLGEEIATPEFARFPVWHGKPHETGALARTHGHALVAPVLETGRRLDARVLARLVELAQWASGEIGRAQDWMDAAPCGEHAGLARVETARGVLLHRARVEDGAIAHYAVVAPTEWNFHPQGAFAHEAACLAGAEAEVMRQANALALSLDPCVEYEVALS
jgi:hypothetical protein